jgi:hypothetical protein
VYNRWGYKSYPGTPTGGTSLSLMKRLMVGMCLCLIVTDGLQYSQIMYNSVYVSFEAAWLYANNNTLSPIGEIQTAARQWVGNHSQDVGVFLSKFVCLLFVLCSLSVC